MSMKILLIVPRLSLDTSPLGVGYLASFLEQHGCDANIILTKDVDDSIFADLLKKKRPSVVAFSALTVWMKEIYRQATQVKSLLSDCVVVCGGIHASALPILTLEECRSLDAVVVGEGEETLLEFVEAIDRDKSLEKIRGLAFREGSKIKKNPETKDTVSLDNLPFPKREILGGLPETLNEVDVLPMRGCPFSCIECSYSAVSGKRLRIRSPKNLVDEIEYLVNEFSPRTINSLVAHRPLGRACLPPSPLK
jgi:anaerobic magnesium-protoporphyrin IX monomethyl ester cyclase